MVDPESPLPVLLAPVPLGHLSDGQDVCRDRGEVAFGSRAFDVFQELETIRQGRPIDTYIYASHDPTKTGGAKASWQARYVGYKPAVLGGAHPDGRLYRPPSTWPEEGKGYWLVYWHVTELTELPPDQQIWIHHFRDRHSGKRAKEPYAPEGPMLKLYP